MHKKSAKEAYKSYFIFNNQRTLSTRSPSELSISETEECSIFVDKTRRYDNQMVIHNACTPEKLEEHLGLFHRGCWPEIAIEPQANTPEIQTWLSNRGFSPAYNHEFLELQTSNYQPSASIPELVSIERWDHSKVDEFLALLKTSGLECTDDIWNDKRSLYCTDTFRGYIATIDGKPCAWATSYLHNDQAILANAYTQESHRHKGCQTALLRARIEEAISLGIQVLLTDVMPNSTSSKNCKSVGFSCSGIRHVYSKD